MAFDQKKARGGASLWQVL